MQYQLIQNFLNLPGIIGFSLMSLNQDGAVHSLGFPQGNGPGQQPLLLEGIQEIIGTTPVFLEFCAFQFGPYQVDLHKIDGSFVLLIFSEGQLTNQYSKAVSELMQFIKADYQALAESIVSLNAANVGQIFPPTAQLQTASVDTVVAAMNTLSQITSRYLGSTTVANSWRTSQLKEIVWLSKFDITATGDICFNGIEHQLSPQQLTDIRLWAQRFHQRCTRFIKDYATLVEETLPEHHRQLLFEP